MKKISKSIVAILVTIVICFSQCIFLYSVKADTTKYTIIDVGEATNYNFNSVDVLNWSAKVGASNESFDDIESKYWPFIGTEITSAMIETKEAIALTTSSGYYDNSLDATDAAYIYGVKSGKDSFNIIQQLAEAYSIDESNIELYSSINMPYNDDGNTSITYVIKNGKLQQTEEEIEANNEIIIAYNKAMFVSGKFADIYNGKFSGTEEKWNDFVEDDERKSEENGSKVIVSQRDTYDFTNISVTAILPDGSEYSLVVGKSGEYFNNWYMIKTKAAPPESAPIPTPEPDLKFETELDYTAIVEEKEVGGELTDGTFYPNYDKENVEKDADVTAIITSITGNDIVQVNDKELKSDGTPNEDGWYYLDINDKKVVAKDYPFDDYDNLDDNGIVVEKGVKLTSSDGLDDTQDISIKWPFRIIKVTQDPEEIDEDTEKVRVEITTNLPIEEEKLPDGWKFTDDDEGKTQHRVYREFEKGENYDKDVILTANNRTDTDKTHVKINWPGKAPEVQTGGNYVAITIAIIICLGIAVVSYRKFNK